MLTGQHACKGACKRAAQLQRNRKRKNHPLGRAAASAASTATRAYPKRLMSVPALPSSAAPPRLAHPSGSLVTPATSPDRPLPRSTSLVRAPCTCVTPLHADARPCPPLGDSVRPRAGGARALLPPPLRHCALSALNRTAACAVATAAPEQRRTAPALPAAAVPQTHNIVPARRRSWQQSALLTPPRVPHIRCLRLHALRPAGGGCRPRLNPAPSASAAQRRPLAQAPCRRRTGRTGRCCSRAADTVRTGLLSDHAATAPLALSPSTLTHLTVLTVCTAAKGRPCCGRAAAG